MWAPRPFDMRSGRTRRAVDIPLVKTWLVNITSHVFLLVITSKTPRIFNVSFENMQKRNLVTCSYEIYININN